MAPNHTAHEPWFDARPLTWWWFSTPRMTFAIAEDYKTREVVIAPPIARKFVGQKTSRLTAWLKRQGGFRWQRLSNPNRQEAQNG